MNPTSNVILEFDANRNNFDKDKKLIDGLSVVVQIEDTLWVANDETTTLERLSLVADGNGQYLGQNHAQFSLAEYLELPVPLSDKLEEVDLEGLAYDDGYLWLVGSHSQKRKKPKSTGDVQKAQKSLAEISSDGNRYLLARIPVVENDGFQGLEKKHEQDGKKRTAAQLRGIEPQLGNDLTEVLQGDEHLGAFMKIPSKDNGFDIEGLAVVGLRLFIGLRGPVLRGWAVILEVEPEEDGDEPSALRLKNIGPDGRSYRKHFLQLGGLGIRDICVQKDDLLILAGPTMDLDGPVTIFRWPKGANPQAETFVPAKDLVHMLDVPYGQGVDHAEGMALFSTDGGIAGSVLVVYDSASEYRQLGESGMLADVFQLPST